MRSYRKEGLTPRLRKATRLMFQMSDEDISRELNVPLEKVEEWRDRSEVKAELRRLHREFKAAASRIAARQAHDAAIKLGDVIGKGDTKVLLDTLKAADAFEYQETEEVGSVLGAMFRAIGEEQSDGSDS